MLKWLSVFAAALLVSLSPAHAQMSDQQRAQAYYFEAEAALADGKLKTADDLRAKAKEALGSDNAKLLYLETRIHFQNGTYETAHRAMQRFYDHDPDPSLIQDMSPYVVKIEAKLEEARLAEIAAREKRIAEEKAEEDLNRRFRPDIWQAARLSCIDEPTCASSIAELDKSGPHPEMRPYRLPILQKQCEEYRIENACLEIAKDPQIDVAERLPTITLLCEKLRHARACYIASIIHAEGLDGTGKPDSFMAEFFVQKACMRDDLVACSKMAQRFGQAGIWRTGSPYTERVCKAMEAPDRHYPDVAIKNACESAGYPVRPVMDDEELRARGEF